MTSWNARLPSLPAMPNTVSNECAIFVGMFSTKSFTVCVTSCSRKYLPIASLRLASFCT